MKDYYAFPSSRVCGMCFRQTEPLHYVQLATAYSRDHSARWACPMVCGSIRHVNGSNRLDKYLYFEEHRLRCDYHVPID